MNSHSKRGASKEESSRYKTRKLNVYPDNWILETEFPDEKSAVDHLTAEKIWSVEEERSYTVIGGLKVYYRCNRAKYDGCSVMKCLYFPRDINEVWLYKTNAKHNHGKTIQNFRKQFWRTPKSRLKSRIIQLTKRLRLDKSVLLQLEYEGFEVKHREFQIRNYCSLVRRRQKNDKWIFEKKFGRKSEAKLFLKRQKIWTLYSQHNSPSGMVYRYRCNVVPKGGPQCAAQKCFCINKYTNEITLFQRSCLNHKHGFIIHQSNLRRIGAKTDSLLKQLNTCDQVALKHQGFRVFEAVCLQDCLDQKINADFVIPAQNLENIQQLKQEANKCDWNAVKQQCFRVLKTVGLQDCFDQKINESLVVIPTRNLENIQQPKQESAEFVVPLHSENSAKEFSCDAAAMGNHIMDWQVSNDLNVSINSTFIDKTIEWRLEHKIPADTILSYLNKQNTWQRKYRCCRSSKVYYCCTMEECKAQMYLNYENKSNETLVYRRSKHNHDVGYETDYLPIHLEGSELIPESYLYTNNILKEELIIEDEPAATTQNESVAVDPHCDNEEEQMSQNWCFQNKFANKYEANEFLAGFNGLWGIKSTTKEKSFYRCTYSCKPQCPAHIFLLFQNGCDEVLYFSRDQHAHPVENGSEPIPTLPDEIIITATEESTFFKTKPNFTTERKCDAKLSLNDSTGIPYSPKSTELIDEIILNYDTDKDSLSGENDRKEWKLDKKFSDFKEARVYLENLNLLSFASHMSKKGVKDYYKCVFDAGNVNHCPASKYLLYEDVNSDILMYDRDIQHATTCKNKIPPLIPIRNRLSPVIDLVKSDDNISDTLSNTITVSSEEGVATPMSIITRRRANPYKVYEKSWYIERYFDTCQEALEYLNDQQIWTSHCRNKSKECTREFYRCNLVKRAGPRCAAAKYLLIDHEKEVISLYEAGEKHTHDEHTPAAQGKQIFDTLDDATRKKVKELIIAGDSPKPILAVLDLQFDSASEKNLYYWIARMRQHMRGKINKYLDKSSFIDNIENWLSQITTIPVSDEAFCVNFDIDNSKKSFRCFLSTWHLLKKAVDSKLVQLDSTYLLPWQENPITIVGTTDLDQNFHLFGIAICSNKNECDYEFIFKAVQQGVHECHKKIFKPECLIADENEAVQNAFLKTFGPSSQIVTCSKVVLSEIMCKLSMCVESEMTKHNIIEDIRKIHKLSSQILFSKAVNLFFQKWLPKAGTQLTDFLNYFKNHWIDRNSNWFQGYRQFTPHSNKAIHLEYSMLRKTCAFKVNLPVQSFRYHIQIEVEKLSRGYGDGHKPFAHETGIPIDVQEKVIEWNELQKQIVVIERQSEILYYFSTDDQKFISMEELQTYRTCHHKTLKEFFDVQFSFCCVRRLLNTGTITCTCSDFMENFICKHSVGISSVPNSLIIRLN